MNWGCEMREENFGPVLNDDGTPTEFTKQMLEGTGRELTPPFNFTDKEIDEVVDEAYNNPIDGFEAYMQNKEMEETEIRRKRHLAAFLGDCGIQTCDVCHPRNQGQSDDPSQHDIPRPNEEPEYNNGPYDYRKPNQYISPFLDFVIKGWLQTFLKENENVPFSEDSNDSWEWTVEEARRLYKEL